ncbi:hypothetical protein HD554DRAFT_2042231 [Boletus coccyginus]|nr:hypothetical protein HD554DRAFT_2042231 [Boletus coccyginus]
MYTQPVDREVGVCTMILVHHDIESDVQIFFKKPRGRLRFRTQKRLIKMVVRYGVGLGVDIRGGNGDGYLIGPYDVGGSPMQSRAGTGNLSNCHVSSPRNALQKKYQFLDWAPLPGLPLGPISRFGHSWSTHYSTGHEDASHDVISFGVQKKHPFLDRIHLPVPFHPSPGLPFHPDSVLGLMVAMDDSTMACNSTWCQSVATVLLAVEQQFSLAKAVPFNPTQPDVLIAAYDASTRYEISQGKPSLMATGGVNQPPPPSYCEVGRKERGLGLSHSGSVLSGRWSCQYVDGSPGDVPGGYELLELEGNFDPGDHRSGQTLVPAVDG